MTLRAVHPVPLLAPLLSGVGVVINSCTPLAACMWANVVKPYFVLSANLSAAKMVQFRA